MAATLGFSLADGSFRAKQSSRSPLSSSISPRLTVAIRGRERVLAALLATMTLAALSPAQAAPALYATSTDAGTSYTTLYTLSTEGRVESYGALGFTDPGNLFTPLTVPIQGLAYGGGSLYATSTDAGTSYTTLYTLNTEGRVESYGALGFTDPGNLFTPLTVPIQGLVYGGGSLYATSTDTGTSFTTLYTLNTEGRVESYGALGFTDPGNLFTPLTVPISALAYAGGTLYATSTDAVSSYTTLYTLNAEGRVESYGALGFTDPGNLFSPLSVPITGLTFEGGSLYATSADAGTSYTTLYKLNTEGRVESYGALGFTDPGNLFTPLTVPINAIAGSVPELSTWSMLLAGFVSLGFAGVRGRRTAGARRILS